MNLVKHFKKTRAYTLSLVEGLSPEVLMAQPAEFTSPAKWHLAHTSWFFERLILQKFQPGYQEFDPGFNFLFNSYYQGLGARLERKDRGQITSPNWENVLTYRQHVDQSVLRLLADGLSAEQEALMELGLQHEMQHQELLLSDLKYILGQQPFKEALPNFKPTASPPKREPQWLNLEGGLSKLGHSGEGFGFDNEKPLHTTYLQDYSLQQSLVNNADWREFVEAGAYHDFKYWHDEGWQWVQNQKIEAPLFWFKQEDNWWEYTLGGFKPLDLERPVAHISYFEAFAFAQWKGLRLPTEAEWEHAADELNWGERWEWTESAYLPYPGYQRYQAEAGEYNAKFMVNQMVLRGASIFTPPAQKRKTYRNFFHAHERWQCIGLRLAKN